MATRFSTGVRTIDLASRKAAAVLAGALMMTAAAAGTARAQLLEEPRPRQGYYLGLGFLGGTSNVREDGESLGAFTGSTNTVRMGQMLTRRLGLGLQINFGSGKNGTQSASLFGLGIEGQLEPVARLALHAGVGLGVMQLQDSAIKNEELRGAFGAQYLLGASYAFFPFGARSGGSGGFSLTPNLQVRFIPGDNATAVGGLLGLELGWWTGLPRNQLELPPEDAYRR